MDKRSKRKFQKSTSTRKIDGALIIFGDIGYNNTRSLFVEAQKEPLFFDERILCRFKLYLTQENAIRFLFHRPFITPVTP